MTNLSPTIARPNEATGFEPVIGTSQVDKVFTVVAIVNEINVESVCIVSPTGRHVRLSRGAFDREAYIGREVFTRAARALENLRRSYREADMRWTHLREVEIEMTGDEMVAFLVAAR